MAADLSKYQKWNSEPYAWHWAESPDRYLRCVAENMFVTVTDCSIFFAPSDWGPVDAFNDAPGMASARSAALTQNCRGLWSTVHEKIRPKARVIGGGDRPDHLQTPHRPGEHTPVQAFSGKSSERSRSRLLVTLFWSGKWRPPYPLLNNGRIGFHQIDILFRIEKNDKTSI